MEGAQTFKSSCRSKLDAVAIFTTSGIVAGIIGAFVTSALIPHFKIVFWVPDHPHSYFLKLRYLMTGCSFIGGGIGLSFSVSLVLARRFWSRWVLSILLTFGSLAFLLHALYALWMRGGPDLATSIHIALAILTLGVPAVSILVLVYPVLAESRTPKQLLILSLPAYVFLEGLGGWLFWHFYVKPETHFVVGWIDGGLFGLFHCLGLVMLSLFRRGAPSTRRDHQIFSAPSEPRDGGRPAIAAADRSRASYPLVQSAVVLGVLLSLMSFGLGLSSILAAQTRILMFQEKDRAALLTIEDLTNLIKNWEPERSAEKSSKVFIPGRGFRLNYEYTDPSEKLAIFSATSIEPSEDDAQSTYWAMTPSVNPFMPTKVRRFITSWVKDENLVKWGNEGAAYLIMEGPAIHGGAFLGYRGRTAILMLFVSLESLEDPKAIGVTLSSVLQRVETYVP